MTNIYQISSVVSVIILIIGSSVAQVSIRTNRVQPNKSFPPTIAQDSKFCPDNFTACPTKSTCCEMGANDMRPNKDESFELTKLLTMDDLNDANVNFTQPLSLSNGGIDYSIISFKKSYGCCPYENGVCCSDHAHCCPASYKCNIPAQKCEQITQFNNFDQQNQVGYGEYNEMVDYDRYMRRPSPYY